MVLDHGKDFEIIRIGDTANDGMSVKIRPSGKGWWLRLTSQNRREDFKVIREAEANQHDVSRLLGELLFEMISEVLISVGTAQMAFNALIRDLVGPWMHRRGYKGSSGRYYENVGDYRVGIEF